MRPILAGYPRARGVSLLQGCAVLYNHPNVRERWLKDHDVEPIS